MLTTGQLAAHATVSEKAVRLYADRGLLAARRDPSSGHRLFEDAQADRLRLVCLLRSLDLSLAEIEGVLDGGARVADFDAVWSARRSDAARVDVAGEYVRGVLAGDVVLPSGLVVEDREVSERVVLRVEGEAALPQMATVLPELTGRLFAALTAADVPLAGPPYVEHRSRATETSPARLAVCAPVDRAMRPPAGMQVVLDPAHHEAFVALRQAQADDQRLLVVVHDHLSAGRRTSRVGPNRETYRPAFGTGADGVVMDVAVPVSIVEQRGRPS